MALSEDPPADIISGPDTSVMLDDGGAQTAGRYLMEIDQAEKDLERYWKRCRKIVKIYTDSLREEHRTDRRFAMLWANTEVLKPTVYARQPKPVVSRRFNDADPTGRALSELLQRSLVSTFDLSNIDLTLRSVRDDFLLIAQGTAWVRYEPKFAMQTFGDEQVNALTDETLAYDFVNWHDFVHPRARRWDELPWIGRRVYLDKKAFTDRFGPELWKKVNGSAEQSKAKTDSKTGVARDKVCIYELWSRRDDEVVWLTKGVKEFLDRQPPLYTLHGFYPCPMPAYGTLASDSLIPTPDYVYYQDQADEINDLTAKIGALEDALKLVGFYPAGAEGEISNAVEKAFAPGSSNQMIPVPGWSVMMQNGGIQKTVEWLPVDMVIKVLQGCVELRKQLIEDVYQITGISDIIRGQSEASETATAQQIKSQWGNIRIHDRQAEMARFARDLARISAEIISEKFQPETLWRMTGLQFPTKDQQAQVQQQWQQQQAMQAQQAQQSQAQPDPSQPGQPPPQQAPQATAQPPQMPPEIERILSQPSQEDIVALMRDDQVRSYRVDIETDSTIEADEQETRKDRNEFVQVVGGFFQQVLPFIQQVPEIAPMVGEMLMFQVRGYGAGRQLEESIEMTMKAIEEKAGMAAEAPPQPDPAIAKIEADTQAMKARLEQEGQLKTQELQQRGKLDAARLQGEGMLKGAEAQQNIALETSRLNTEAALEIRRQNMDAVARQHESGLKAQQQARDAAMRPRGLVRQ